MFNTTLLTKIYNAKYGISSKEILRFPWNPLNYILYHFLQGENRLIQPDSIDTGQTLRTHLGHKIKRDLQRDIQTQISSGCTDMNCLSEFKWAVKVVSIFSLMSQQMDVCICSITNW